MVQRQLIADERIYRGEAEPVTGGVARTRGELAELWEAVGFFGEVPELDDRGRCRTPPGQDAERALPNIIAL